jgi:acyl-CoA synthetase (AMP-forming)/AMP-acid ligase II
MVVHTYLNTFTANMTTLPSHLFHSQPQPHRPAVLLPPSALLASEASLSICYKELKDHSLSLATLLQTLGPPQTTVSLSLNNSIEFVTAFLALAQNSFIGMSLSSSHSLPDFQIILTFLNNPAAPLNPAYTQDEAGKSDVG